MSSLLDWIEKHPALVAWVQAVAVIITIAGTRLAGWLFQRSEQHTERRTMAEAMNEVIMAVEVLVRSIMNGLSDEQAMGAIAAGEKSFDIRTTDELKAAITVIQLHNLSTPELVRGVIALLTGARQLREQLAGTIATRHRVGATHFSELFKTPEGVQAAITRASRNIAAHVSQIQSSATRPAITPTGRIIMPRLSLRTGGIAWAVFLFALTVLIIYKIAPVLLVTVFAVFFSYLLYPLIERLKQCMPRQAPYSVSVSVVFIFVVSVVIVADLVLSVAVQKEADRLADQLPRLLDTSTMADRLTLPNFLKPLRAHILEFPREQLSTTSDQTMLLVRNIDLGVTHAASSLVYPVFIPAMSSLMINEAPSICAALLSWIRFSDKRLWGNTIDGLDTLLSCYMRALLLLSLTISLFYSITSYLLGVPYALLLAATAAALESIPFTGPLATVVTIVIAAVFSGYPHLFQLIGLIVAYRLSQDYVLNPCLVNEGVRVSPFLVIAGLLAGGQSDDVVGTFLSISIIVALKIVLSRARTAQSLDREVR